MGKYPADQSTRARTRGPSRVYTTAASSLQPCVCVLAAPPGMFCAQARAFATARTCSPPCIRSCALGARAGRPMLGPTPHLGAHAWPAAHEQAVRSAACTRTHVLRAMCFAPPCAPRATSSALSSTSCFFASISCSCCTSRFQRRRRLAPNTMTSFAGGATAAAAAAAAAADTRRRRRRRRRGRRGGRWRKRARAAGAEDAAAERRWRGGRGNGGGGGGRRRNTAQGKATAGEPSYRCDRAGAPGTTTERAKGTVSAVRECS